MARQVRLGISTCPNDTFAFAALLDGRVRNPELDLQIELLDIQQLNEGLRAGRFDVAKTSFFAAAERADRVVVLPSGSALGFGVGPLLLAARPETRPEAPTQLTLGPGAQTTATMLFRIFYGQTTRLQQTVFSNIMPRLQANEADFGVCIHEGRFTWQQAGLACVEDLGQRWERDTNMPLPLGGLVAERTLPDGVIANVQSLIHDSLQDARAEPQRALPQMRRHAQEFDDAVLMQHVELYVNQWTVELGDVGGKALQVLSERIRQAGLFAEPAPPSLEVWSPR